MAMKASELCTALSQQIAIRGDLPVLFQLPGTGGVMPVDVVQPRVPGESEPGIWLTGDWCAPPSPPSRDA
jgi:hypothetical protein